ncbi:MAG: hypothetical protein R3330_13050, partial [Saprospiraceae bacterium]|nr:hypothetical protein [Saprospiraceae bacterium]
LLLQPYVENAIWHGLMHRDTPGALTILVEHQHEDLKITIEDDGIGREQATLLNSKSALKKNSLGMKLTSDRMKMSEALHNMSIQVDIKDLYSATGHPVGTRVTILMTSQNIAV